MYYIQEESKKITIVAILHPQEILDPRLTQREVTLGRISSTYRIWSPVICQPQSFKEQQVIAEGC